MKAVIAMDDASYTITQEEEIRQVKIDLIEECGDVFEFGEINPERFNESPPADIYIIDFGGLGVGYTGSIGMADICGHHLATQIKNHPGSLFVIWSQFTALWYGMLVEEELRLSMEEGKVPKNVVMYRPRKTLTDDTINWRKIRTWLGIEKKPELTDEELDALYDRFPIVPPVPEEDAEEVDPLEPDWKLQELEDEKAQELEAEENPRKRRKMRKNVVPFLRTSSGEEELPKRERVGPIEEPIGYIKIPVYCSWRKGQTSGKFAFKFTDCICDVTDDEDEDKHLGTIGGAIGGLYEIHFDDKEEEAPGEGWSYRLTPQEIWEQMKELHEEFRKKVLSEIKGA